MPPPPSLTKALKAVMQSGLPDHYRLVLVSLLRHQVRQKDSPQWGLAWPSVDKVAGDTKDVTPEQVATALQHMAHARILRSHGTTSGGVVFWEIRIEQLAITDPLLQTMLSTRLRTVEGLRATERHVLHELSMLANTTLGVTAGFRHIKRSLPWLTLRAWRRSIHQLTSAGVLREVSRGNRFHSTTWQIQVPQQPEGVQLPSPQDAGGVQLPASSRTGGVQLPGPQDAEGVQLPGPQDAGGVQLPASSRTGGVQLPSPQDAGGVQLPASSRTGGVQLSIARVYRPVVARVIDPPCGPVDGLLSPLGLRVNHLLSVEQGPVG